MAVLNANTPTRKIVNLYLKRQQPNLTNFFVKPGAKKDLGLCFAIWSPSFSHGLLSTSRVKSENIYRALWTVYLGGVGCESSMGFLIQGESSFKMLNYEKLNHIKILNYILEQLRNLHVMSKGSQRNERYSRMEQF